MSDPARDRADIPSPADVPWEIGPMAIERDLDGILAVDRASFTNPWTREMFEWEAAHSDVARVYVVRAGEAGIIAYCAVWIVIDELHINNLAVLPGWRRRGVARALLATVLAEARRLGAVRATLEVRASNQAARSLYERAGFRPAGLRRGYYTNPVEDALVLWCDLAPADRA
jgi:ribosomal-protein-alanine N-acetyltransferase